MAKIGFRRQINVGRVVTKVVATVITLYVGGYLLTEVGDVMNATCSPFYEGLNLIGWTTATNYCTTTSADNASTLDSSSTAGILSVIGLVAIASIVTEFVSFRM